MARPEFHYHVVSDEVGQQMADVRRQYILLSELLDERLPASRAASLAQTRLEESLMRAIQALALQGEKVDPWGREI